MTEHTTLARSLALSSITLNRFRQVGSPRMGGAPLARRLAATMGQALLGFAIAAVAIVALSGVA